MNCLSGVSGGAVSYLRNVVPLLNKMFSESQEGHKLFILAHESQKNLFAGVPSENCHWITGQRKTGLKRIIWERRRLADIVLEKKAGVFFTPYQIGERIADISHVMMLTNMEPFLFGAYNYSAMPFVRNSILRRKSSHDLRLASRVIAISTFVESQLESGLGISPERIRKIYPGKDKLFSPVGAGVIDDKLLENMGIFGEFLLTCGSLLPYRRCEDVIGAFDQHIGSVHKKIKLVIAGSGTDGRYLKLIRRAIANSPYHDRIIMVGHVSTESMVALYRNCMVCIIASEIEACPTIAIEAMSSGCAIVSCDRQPLPEIFQGSSLEFESRDIESMGRQLNACLSDDGLRAELGLRAQRRSKDFSWEKCATETFAALTEWPKE